VSDSKKCGSVNNKPNTHKAESEVLSAFIFFVRAKVGGRGTATARREKNNGNCKYLHVKKYTQFIQKML
jgi:hypothetical protein